jgi:hypothetical protein
MHGRAYGDCRVRIEEAIKNNPRAFFGFVDLKKKATRRLCISTAYGLDNICDLFADL